MKPSNVVGKEKGRGGEEGVSDRSDQNFLYICKFSNNEQFIFKIHSENF